MHDFFLYLSGWVLIFCNEWEMLTQILTFLELLLLEFGYFSNIGGEQKPNISGEIVLLEFEHFSRHLKLPNSKHLRELLSVLLIIWNFGTQIKTKKFANSYIFLWKQKNSKIAKGCLEYSSSVIGGIELFLTKWFFLLANLVLKVCYILSLSFVTIWISVFVFTQI